MGKCESTAAFLFQNSRLEVLIGLLPQINHRATQKRGGTIKALMMKTERRLMPAEIPRTAAPLVTVAVNDGKFPGRIVSLRGISRRNAPRKKA